MTLGAAFLLHAAVVVLLVLVGLFVLVALVWVMAVALMWAANPIQPKTTLDLLVEDLYEDSRFDSVDLSRLDRLDGLGGDRR
ncbi:hypothetical protein [Arthrobacter rhombi]|uniref:hypothetical protein n=1 Tax=Arthrobacter rhombi TaxID=71253 RepID=UPI003FD4B744